MSRFLAAALQVMSTTHPMTAREITAEALRRGLLTTNGRTPEATLAAALYLEAKAETPRVQRQFEPGAMRAQRNTVRWLAAPRVGGGVGRDDREPRRAANRR